MRILLTLNEEEEQIIRRESSKIGLSPSAYCKYRALLGSSDTNQKSLPELIKIMHEALDKKVPGDMFIVSSLLPSEWITLNRSQKGSLAQNLARTIKANPDKFDKKDRLSDGTTVYIRL